MLSRLSRPLLIWLASAAGVNGDNDGPRCRASADEATLSDERVSISFGFSHPAAHAGLVLTRLANGVTGHNYLAGGVNAAGGNPFRLLLSPTRIPPAADVTGSPYGDPSFADSPWPDGALGGTFVDASAFTVVSQACAGAAADPPQLLLTMALGPSHCTFASPTHFFMQT